MKPEDKAVIKQVLEAFENIAGWYDYESSTGELASAMYEASCVAKLNAPALRQLLEQPEPVPVQEQFDPKLLGDLKKLMGLPPYNESSNTAMGDGCFSAHLIRTHGKEKFDAAVAYLRSGATPTPPAQPAAWVGLTNEDYPDADNPYCCVNADFIAGARWADAKLREKNGY
jgi:hypothetical protein